MEKINFEEFKKIDIRVGKILTAEKIDGSDKLLKLEVDFTEEKRQIVAGIAQFYSLEFLIGKESIFVFNLEPRTLKGLESNGMILCASNGGKPVLLTPVLELPPGCMVK